MSDPSLRILFAGTPEFAARHLAALLASRHKVIAAYTQPDRPSGRGKKVSASPVKTLAALTGTPVLQPLDLKSAEEQARLAAWDADVMVVVAYGLLLPQAVLDAPRLGCINVHASILPRWRGAAPIQRAIEAGDEESGVTIMQMDAGLDTGAMLTITRCPILPSDSAANLHDRLLELGPKALLQTLDELAHGRIDPVSQDNALATYARKLSKEEAQLDWTQTAAVLDRKIRAFNPAPVSHTQLEGERIRIFDSRVTSRQHSDKPGEILVNGNQLLVCCGEGSVLELLSLQLPGGKPLCAKDALNGFSARFHAGKCFSQ